MNLICKMIFGSHLYGTNTKSSDIDYKGIFLPSKEDIFLGRVQKSYNESTKKGSDSKNTPDDIDTEIYSLQYFIKLACEGQTVAIDMLHAPDSCVLFKTPIWDAIVSNRKKFYTKNLKAFIGYARKQAAKYGVKGSRLSAAGDVIRFLNSHSGDLRLSDLWDGLPIGAHSYMVDQTPNGLRQYQICGKIIQESCRVDYVLGILNNFYEAYGKRAQQAAENKGIDWKAISHALRAAYQVKELLTDNTVTFPLPNAEYLKSVKLGGMDYTTEVLPVLEGLMDEVEYLSSESELPEKVSMKFWDKFLIDTIEREVINVK